jgi:hypothetical protein
MHVVTSLKENDMHPQLTAVVAADHIDSLRRQHSRVRATRSSHVRLWRYLRDARTLEQPEIHRP